MNLQFIQALNDLRNGAYLTPIIDWRKSDAEEMWEKSLEQEEQRAANGALFQYYSLGEHIRTSDKKITKRTHRIGTFLYDYFNEEPAAIWHLTGVTVNAIGRISNTDQRIILNNRPIILPDLMDWGPVQTSPGELWYTGMDMPYIPPPLVSPTIENISFKEIARHFDLPSSPMLLTSPWQSCDQNDHLNKRSRPEDW